MNNKLKKNIQFGFLMTILLMILNFLLKKILFKNLTENEIGTMQLIIQILSYLNIVELGIGTSVSFFFFKAYSKNIGEVIKIFSQTTIIYKRIFIVANFIGCILIYFLKFSIKSELNYELILMWIFYQLSLTINFLNMPKIILFNSNQHNYIIILLEGIFKLLVLFFQIVSIIFYKNLLIFFGIELISSILKFLILNKLYSRYYKEIKVVKAKFSLEILKKTGIIFFHKMANIFVNNTDYILISRYISISTIALYSNYVLIVNATKTILYVFINAFISNLGHNYFKINLDEKNKTLKEYNLYFSFLATLLAIGFYYNINSFISFWIGEKYLLSNQIKVCFTISIYYFTIRQPIEIYKGVSGYYSDIVSPISEIFLNIIISIILIKKIGLLGVVIGTLLASFIANFVIKTYLTLKNLELSIFLYYTDILKHLLISLLLYYFINNIIKELKLENINFKNFIFLNLIIISGLILIYFLIYKISKKED